MLTPILIWLGLIMIRIAYGWYCRCWEEIDDTLFDEDEW